MNDPAIPILLSIGISWYLIFGCICAVQARKYFGDDRVVLGMAFLFWPIAVFVLVCMGAFAAIGWIVQKVLMFFGGGW